MNAKASYARATSSALAITACLTLLLAGTSRGFAQAIPVVETSADKVGDIHITPVMRFNFLLNYAAQHNSATGWANVVLPSLAYRFNRHLSVDTSVPWYPTLNANVKTTAAGVTTYPLKAGRNILGDANISGHLEFQPRKFEYMLTPTVGFATGNSRYGLSANATTYNFTNHAEYSIGPFLPDIEIGFGNSSSLANQFVRKAYTAVGSIANFQIGTSIDLPFNLNLDLEAYEDLPVGNQNVYGTISRKHKKGKPVTTTVLEGTGVAEDNGFNTELDLPVGHHIMLNGSYERSLIQGLDTASVGMIFILRSPKISRSR